MNQWLVVILVLSIRHLNAFVINTSSLQIKRVRSPLWISFDNNNDSENEVSLLDSSYTSVLTCNGNNKNDESELQRLVVNPLIQKLEELYQDAREPNEGRFVWDPWVAPTTTTTNNEVQYSMKRATLSSILTSQDEDEQLLETMNECHGQATCDISPSMRQKVHLPVLNEACHGQAIYVYAPQDHKQ